MSTKRVLVKPCACAWAIYHFPVFPVVVVVVWVFPVVVVWGAGAVLMLYALCCVLKVAARACAGMF